MGLEGDSSSSSSWNRLQHTSLTILVPAAFIVLCMLSACSVYFWKCVQKRRRKEMELDAMTPKYPGAHQYTGVRADQPIQFVVPTITLSETSYSVTEESISESDYTSGMGYGSDRDGKKRAGRFSINPGDIQKGLYEEDMDDGLTLHGKVHFVLHYSFYRQQLLATILSAKNLPSKKSNLNPFAKISLLPDATPKFVTKVQRSTSDPLFNELFIFPAKRTSLDDRILKISVWNSDSFSRKSFIGQCLFPLKDAKIDSSITSDVITDDISCDLTNRQQSSGEVLLSLTYKPETSTLTLGVEKSRNISIKDIQTVYIKVALFLRKKRVRSRKSPVRRATHEIEFNDTFHVHAADHVLSDIIIGVTVYGRSSSIASKSFLGRTYVGEHCLCDQGKQHWNDMKEHVNSTVNHWHKLF